MQSKLLRRLIVFLASLGLLLGTATVGASAQAAPTAPAKSTEARSTDASVTKATPGQAAAPYRYLRVKVCKYIENEGDYYDWYGYDPDERFKFYFENDQYTYYAYVAAGTCRVFRVPYYRGDYYIYVYEDEDYTYDHYGEYYEFSYATLKRKYFGHNYVTIPINRYIRAPYAPVTFWNYWNEP